MQLISKGQFLELTTAHIPNNIDWQMENLQTVTLQTNSQLQEDMLQMTDRLYIGL